MTRIRVQRSRKTRRRAPSPAPLENITRSSAVRSQLLGTLEDVLEEIDQALDEAAK